MQVTVIGAGYVGLIAAVCLAESGHTVKGVDVDHAKVEALRAGRSPIYEPGIEELIASGLASGRLSFHTPDDGWRELISEITIVAVGTPMAESGAADLSQVRDAVAALCAEADIPFTLVMKSTVAVGTGNSLIERFLSRAGVPITYVSNPEFLREGRAISDWYETDRIVLGAADPTHLAPLRDLYADIVAPVLETDIASAETIKYASNAFLATKISFINEIANFCDVVGADIDDVSHGIGMDARISPHFLHAGIGYGGSCFPKDTRALDFIAAMNGYQFSLLKSVIDVNNRQRLLPVIRLTDAMDGMDGRRIALLGLSFKPHTDDVRESPAVDMIPLLLEAGASVVTYDPLAVPVEMDGVERCATVWEALAGASAVIVATEWGEFSALDWSRVRGVMEEPAIVFDGRNCLDADAVRAAGLTYMAVGRPGAHRIDSKLRG
ncbi:MAG: UDP-glucose/GDP-mannose dehydrogenase family protein [Coriobacteriia bacterium]|nr:UDP-glucose/GDP-mannose dehydrogenase family protein [Coriobacteriia bacterium]